MAFHSICRYEICLGAVVAVYFVWFKARFGLNSLSMSMYINLLDTGRSKLRYLSVLKSSSGSDVSLRSSSGHMGSISNFSMCWPKKLSLFDICNALRARLCVESDRGDRKEM